MINSHTIPFGAIFSNKLERLTKGRDNFWEIIVIQKFISLFPLP